MPKEKGMLKMQLSCRKIFVLAMGATLLSGVARAGIFGLTPSKDTVLVVGQEYKFSASYVNKLGKGQSVEYGPTGGNSSSGMEAGWASVGNGKYRITSLGNGRLTAQWFTGGVPNEDFAYGDVVYKVTDKAVSPSGLFFDATGGSGTIEILAASSVSWNVVNTDPEWVSVDTTSGSGNRNIKVTVASNPTPDARTANIRVAGSIVSIMQYANEELRPEINVAYVDDTCLVSITWPSDWDLFYTLDGSNPEEGGVLYETPIVLSRGGPKHINAIAVSFDGRISKCATRKIAAPNAPTISPSGGIITGSSVSVNISSDNPDATIYYTTDGTEPTTASPVYSRFKAAKKLTVKAIAVVPGMMEWSETATAEYALGQCEDPVIMPVDGTVFSSSNTQLSIKKIGEKGVLRYTLNGTEPTEESPIYLGPFTISQTTTVKAKVFDDEYFDSQTVTATLTRKWNQVQAPVIIAPISFTGSRALVSISCLTAGAIIRYTLDGSEPNSHSRKYTEPFEVNATTTVKAYATLLDWTPSDVSTSVIEKQWCIGDALNMPDHSFVTTSVGGWVSDKVVTQDGTESMRSGPIGDSDGSSYSETILSTVVEGEGTLSFWWKASCEQDDEYEWDHGDLLIDGEVVARINGQTGWLFTSCEVAGLSKHIVEWRYLKDDFAYEGDDCIWVDVVSWVPRRKELVVPSDVTGGKDLAVDETWPNSLDECFGSGTSAAFVEKFGSDLSAALLKPSGKKDLSGNDMYVWQDYVAGTDPTDQNSKFTAKVKMVDGKPVVSWSPNRSDRVYRVLGSSDLKSWREVGPGEVGAFRFFRVSVEMP